MIQRDQLIQIFEDAEAKKAIVVKDFDVVLDICLGEKNYHPSASKDYHRPTRAVVQREAVFNAQDKLKAIGYYDIDQLDDVFSSIMANEFAGSALKLYPIAIYPEAYFRTNVFDSEPTIGCGSPLASSEETNDALREQDKYAYDGHRASQFGKQTRNPFGYTQAGIADKDEDFNARIEALRQDTFAFIIKQYERDLAYKAKNEINTLFPDTFNDWFNKKEFESLTKDSKEAKLQYNAYVSRCAKNRNELQAEARLAGFVGTIQDYLKFQVLDRLKGCPAFETYLIRRAAYEEWLKILIQAFSYTVFRYYMNEFNRVKSRKNKNDRKAIETNKVADDSGISTSKAKIEIRRHQKTEQAAATVKNAADFESELRKQAAQVGNVLSKRRIEGLRKALEKSLLEKRLGVSGKFLHQVCQDGVSEITRCNYLRLPVNRPANLKGGSCESSNNDNIGLRKGGKSTCAAPS